MERGAGAEAKGAGDAEAKTTGRRRGGGAESHRGKRDREPGGRATREDREAARSRRGKEPRGRGRERRSRPRGPGPCRRVPGSHGHPIRSGRQAGGAAGVPHHTEGPRPPGPGRKAQGPHWGGAGLLHLPALAPGAQTLSTTVAPREASPSSQLTQTQGAPTLP